MSEEGQINRLVGQRIAAFRRFQELSRGSLGEKIGIGEQQMGRVERGQSAVSASQIIKLSEILDIRPSQLLDVDHALK